MFNLFEIMRNAQNGEGIANLARQFGLPPDQAQRALEALLPAFSMGFQRNAQDPNVFANLLGQMGSGQFKPFYEQAARAFTPQAQTSGNDILGQLFGSKEVSRQIAQHASAMTGIGTQVLQQMLPLVATMVMGGLFKSASDQGLGGMMKQWTDMMQGGLARPAPQPAPPPPNANPWSAMMEAMLGAATGKAPPKPAPTAQASNSYGANPYGAWGEMISSMMGAAAPQAAPNPSPKTPPQSPGQGVTPNPFEALAGMIQAGREVQDQHLANLRGVFDQAWSQNPPGQNPPGSSGGR